MNTPPKHLVHGKWMTVVEAASLLGVRAETLKQWRYTNRQPDGKPARLETAWDFYSAVNAGQIPRRPGRTPKRHRFKGRLMTTREAARAIGVDAQRVWVMVHRYGISTEAALERCEQITIRKAVQKILKIIYGEV